MNLFDLIFKNSNKTKTRTASDKPCAVHKKTAQKTENINGIFITYKKHPFSKSIRITPKANGEVLVTLPKNTSYSCAKDFVLKNIGWIKENIKSKKLIPLDIIDERRRLAHKILPKRLDELAHKFGFKYRKLFIKNQKTVWGSCSYMNNINLNLNLVALDKEFIDYVILHELTHTVHKNHQKAFYNLLTKNMPDALEIQKRLKKIKISSLA